MNKSAANTPRTRTKKAAKREKKREVSPEETEFLTNPSRIRYAFVPILREFRQHTKRNEARLWIPIETSLLVRYEFASCSLQTRYVFVAILLYCGANGLEEIPLDARFMSSVLVADFRTVEKSFDELLSKNLLQEREKREKRKEQTDRKETPAAGVSVDSENLSQNNSEEARPEKVSKKEAHGQRFTIFDRRMFAIRREMSGERRRDKKRESSGDKSLQIR